MAAGEGSAEGAPSRGVDTSGGSSPGPAGQQVSCEAALNPGAPTPSSSCAMEFAPGACTDISTRLCWSDRCPPVRLHCSERLSWDGQGEDPPHHCCICLAQNCFVDPAPLHPGPALGGRRKWHYSAHQNETLDTCVSSHAHSWPSCPVQDLPDPCPCCQQTRAMGTNRAKAA